VSVFLNVTLARNSVAP